MKYRIIDSNAVTVRYNNLLVYTIATALSRGGSCITFQNIMDYYRGTKRLRPAAVQKALNALVQQGVLQEY